MQFIRSSFLSRLTSIFTCLIFLNLSFVMVEVSVFKLDKDQQAIEGLAKLIADCSSEEESDGFGGLSDEDPVKEISVFVSTGFTLAALQSLDSPALRGNENQGIPRFGNYEIYSPPPES
jgi:hypothetical protein